MQELQLIKSEKFGEIETDIYSGGEDMFMTADQLGNCLGYSVPAVAMSKMITKNNYLKNSDFSVVTKMVSTDGKYYNTRLFNEDGIYEITFLSKTDKAKEFRKWVRGILKALRKGELQLSNQGYSLVPVAIQNQIDKLLLDNNNLKQVVGSIQSQLYSLHRDVRQALPMKHYTNFKNTLNPKIDALAEYLKLERIKVLSSLYKQMSIDADIDLNQYKSEYVTNNGLSNCSMLDVIDSSNELQILMNTTVDNLLDIYNLKVKQTIEKSPFETNPVKLAVTPLIEKYQDKSKGGNATYRKVYSSMGVDWNRRLTRFKNLNHTKNLPTKMELIKKDDKVRKLFLKTVQDLLK